jgi:hypothetical protein
VFVQLKALHQKAGIPGNQAGCQSGREAWHFDPAAVVGGSR